MTENDFIEIQSECVNGKHSTQFKNCVKVYEKDRTVSEILFILILQLSL